MAYDLAMAQTIFDVLNRMGAGYYHAFGRLVIAPRLCGDELQVQPQSFVVRYTTHSRDSEIQHQEETITVEAETYWKQYNGVGPLHLHPTYRSLLLAEMEFLDRLSVRGLGGLYRYEVFHDEMGRCSEFVVD